MFRLICSLLEQYESDTIASDLRTVSDVNLFLNFVLHVRILHCAYQLVMISNTLSFQLLHSGRLSDSGVQDASRKARSLMFKLIERRDMIPKSLFITDITKTEVEAVDIASICVFQGEHEGKQVMLRAVLRVPDDVSAL